MTYADRLSKTKELYPFEKWRQLFFPDEEDDFEGMEQYTEENCARAQKIFDDLIDNLMALGEDAAKAEKEQQFQTAIEATNVLSAEVEDLIETGEREDLCDLIDEITRAANLNPQDYANGDGIADLWRAW